MSIFDDLFDPKPDITTNSSTSSNTSVAGPENWQRKEGHTLYKQAAKSIPTSFKRYKGTRVANYGPGMTQAKRTVTGMAGDSAAWFGANRSKLDQLWGASADAMHKSGKDYMNPYLEGVLQPQIRGIDEDRRRTGLEDDRAATMAGAFGDPRAGLRKAVTNSKYATLKSDATAKGYSDAFDRGTQVHESEMARLMALPGMYSGIESQRFNQQGDITRAQANFGLADQALAQKKYDVKYDDWQKQQSWRTNRAEALMKLLGAAPANKQATASTSANGWGSQPAAQQGWQMLGQAGGALLGPSLSTGGTKLSSMLWG